MSPKTRILLAVTILIITSLACEYLPTPEPELPPGEVIATSVAATVAAGAGDPATAEPGAPSGPHLVLTALGDAVQAYLSSDGQMVAFVRQFDWNNQEIYAVNTDGSNLHPLVTLADFATMKTMPEALTAVPYRIAWAPDTHTLSFMYHKQIIED